MTQPSPSGSGLKTLVVATGLPSTVMVSVGATVTASAEAASRHNASTASERTSIGYPLRTASESVRGRGAIAVPARGAVQPPGIPAERTLEPTGGEGHFLLGRKARSYETHPGDSRSGSAQP